MFIFILFNVNSIFRVFLTQILVLDVKIKLHAFKLISLKCRPNRFVGFLGEITYISVVFLFKCIRVKVRKLFYNFRIPNNARINFPERLIALFNDIVHWRQCLKNRSLVSIKVTNGNRWKL